MYGRFTTTQLQKYAKDQAARLRKEEKLAKEKQIPGVDTELDDEFRPYQDTRLGAVKR